MSDHQIFSLLAEYRHALDDCRKIYLDAGNRIVQEHPNMLQKSDSKFVTKMDDLHKALVIKIYVTICEADRRWSSNERILAEVLIQHVWNRHLEGDELKEAIKHLSKKSPQLKWYALVRPFDQIAPLREMISRLETSVMRIANIVARADGDPAPNVMGHVKHVQYELSTHLRPVPIDEPSQRQEADRLGGQAIQTVEKESQKVRTQYKIETESEPEQETKSQDERLAEALQELDQLIGLAGVKQEVKTLINFLKIQQERIKAGLPQTKLSLHMVFAGNPGTGKTTIARIVGKIFGAMGILEKGHVVETDRSGLVAEYAGQTGPKANKKIDEATGGVLFIDEAYSLIAKEGDDPFGREAIQTLLKRMEDDREQLVVIIAGYPKEMGTLLASNPGLTSRFSRHVTFEDYEPEELCRIFHRMCVANQYELPQLSRIKLMLGFDWIDGNKDRHFGNGRTARNLFEHAIRLLANRLVHIGKLSKEHLTTLQPEDIEFIGNAIRSTATKSQSNSLNEALKEFGIESDDNATSSTKKHKLETLFDNLDDTSRTIVVTCTGCRKRSKVPQNFICHRVACKRCDNRFVAEWGEIVPTE